MSALTHEGGEQPKGRYIVLEGGEGVGKTTQIKLLVGRLALFGIETRSDIREPGGTPMGEEIRRLLKDQDLPRAPETNLALFNAARIELQQQVIVPELEANKWVVCDRNRLSSHAYQGHGEGLSLRHVRDECDRATQYAAVDLEMVLWVDEPERQHRLAERGGTDYFEAKDPRFHQRVIAGYEKEATVLGIPYIDGNGSPEEVHERIWEYVEPLTKREE